MIGEVYAMKFLISLLFLLTIGCKNKTASNDIQSNISLVCRKVVECYNIYYRTYPNKSELKKMINDCEAKALDNWKNSTAENQQVTQLCFQKMLSGDCKNFKLVAFASPECQIARAKNTK